MEKITLSDDLEINFEHGEPMDFHITYKDDPLVYAASSERISGYNAIHALFLFGKKHPKAIFLSMVSQEVIDRKM